MSKAYTGVSRQLVIAFDIGTTYSGVSYCLLDPGQEPKICNITRYPGQEHVSGSSKIPTILCYDSQGSLRAAGAEALLPENIEKFEDEEWVKAEWFKLRMHPASMQAADLPPLPPNKSLVQVFADFIGYLMACAKTFICETHLTLSNSWDTLKNNMTFVMGHPNGWEGAQQSLMRQAAIMANIIPDTTDGHSRVRFVTEGEASLHYCLREISLDDVKRGFVIADLGGGTLDFSAYKVAETKPMRVEEISAPKYKLQNSRYGSDEHVKQIGERFDETTKKIFRDTNDVCVVPFGSISDKDMENEIRSGKLKLSGDDVASFFKPAITASVTAIVDLINESSTPIKTVYLVGGFSASPYLTAQLVKHLSIFNISVTCPDGQTAKAVADGAISFYLDQFVSSRVSKASYGIEISYDYDSTDPEHNARMEDLSRQPSGRYVVSGGFATILKRSTLVSEETEYRLPFNIETRTKNNILTCSVELLAFRGNDEPPLWIDQAQFTTLCTVTANAFSLKNLSRKLTGPNGEKYWSQNYALVLLFGGTELKAQISWFEKGIEKRGPAQIVYGEVVQ